MSDSTWLLIVIPQFLVDWHTFFRLCLIFFGLVYLKGHGSQNQPSGSLRAALGKNGLPAHPDKIIPESKLLLEELYGWVTQLCKKEAASRGVSAPKTKASLWPRCGTAIQRSHLSSDEWYELLKYCVIIIGW